MQKKIFQNTIHYVLNVYINMNQILIFIYLFFIIHNRFLEN